MSPRQSPGQNVPEPSVLQLFSFYRLLSYLFNARRLIFLGGKLASFRSVLFTVWTHLIIRNFHTLEAPELLSCPGDGNSPCLRSASSFLWTFY